VPEVRQKRGPARWVLAVIAVAILVVAVDIGAFLLARGGTMTNVDAEAAPGGAVAVIDPVAGRLVDQIAVGHQPTIIRAGYGAAWVLNKADGTVTQIDGRSHKVVDTLAPDAAVNALTVGAGGVWLAGRPQRDLSGPLELAALERINPATGAVDRSFETRTGTTVFAAGGGSLWSTGFLGGHIRGAARSDAVSGAMRKLEIGIYGDLVAADDLAAYYVATVGDRIVRVSTRTGLLTNTLPLATDASLAAGNVPPNPTDVAVGGGAVWISETDGTVLRIEPRLGRITASIPACKNALAIAYGEGAVWVACGNNTVVRVDPATDSPAAPILVGRLPRGIAAGAGAIWVTLN
jgi:DNA-binding beta-propeller fold protein YncE